MKISIPYSYELRYQLPGSRKVHKTFVGNSLNVDVEDLTDDAAPVALSYPSRLTKSGRQDVRYLDGHYFYADIHDAVDLNSVQIECDVNGNTIYSNIEYLYFQKYFGNDDLGYEGFIQTPSSFDFLHSKKDITVLQSTEADALRNIQTNLHRLRSIAGHLHLEMAEPAYMLVNLINIGCIIEPAADDFLKRGYCTLFAADELDSLHHHALHSDPDIDLDPNLKITIHIDCPLFDFSGPYLEKHARSVIGQLASKAGEFDIETFGKFASVRDLLERPGEKVDLDLCDGLSALLIHLRHQAYAEKMFLTPDLSRDATLATDRYRSRAMELEAALAPHF